VLIPAYRDSSTIGEAYRTTSRAADNEEGMLDPAGLIILMERLRAELSRLCLHYLLR
jgi:hypothetical protein